MYCVECGQLLPSPRDASTICSKCKTPLSTWWDESTQTSRTNRESTTVPPERQSAYPKTAATGSAYAMNASGSGGGSHLVERAGFVEGRGGLRYGGAAGFVVGGVGFGDAEGMSKRRNQQTEEERNFNAALVTLELHFERPGTYLMKAMVEVKKMVARTLDLSLNKAEVRETLAKNVDVWMHLQKIFNTAIPSLDKWSLGGGSKLDSHDGVRNGHDVSESAELILKNYDALREDLHYLNNLLVISRNMLAIKDTAQDICAAVRFDRAVQRLMVLCVNVTSKGYDGETVDVGRREKLNEITELYKKLLVTCLQHTHNWTMGNDRFKMSFWYEMLFDEDLKNDPIHEMPPDDLDVEKVHIEVSNWIRRHHTKDPLAAKLLDKYSAEVSSGYTPGKLPQPEYDDVDSSTVALTSPVWKPDLEDKYEQDRLYARVSHEIDVWWKKVRDANFDGWVVQMETVERAQERAAACKENAMHRYMPRGQEADHYDQEEHYEQLGHGQVHSDEIDERSIEGDNGEDDDDEEDDDESYAEGPLRGLLTEIPNILDTKQIEALHMTVKACIVDSMGSGLTPAGENLQKTRCKMFLALDCGKNLLRELLVFIAVWEQTDQQFIFQITAQIIESFHHNALLPYAWNSLRILKDIVSPAQTVLLRLINYMFRARKDSPIYDDVKDYQRDAKLIHFLYNYFRSRVVPDCLALIYAQAQIRQQKKHHSDFPVDLWDMERAKDGLSQYLDFISVIAEITEMRHLLIEWETVYELVALLKALEAGVARKSLDERPMPNQPPSQTQSPLHDTPHKFPWSGIKIQILIILTALIAPTNARRNGPGNPTVQKQLLDHEGIMPLLNCCVYDGHNEYLKERATLAIKFLMEGCKEAQDFVKELVPIKQAQVQAQAAVRAQAEANARNGGAGAVAGSERTGQTARQTAGNAARDVPPPRLGGIPNAAQAAGDRTLALPVREGVGRAVPVPIRVALPEVAGERPQVFKGVGGLSEKSMAGIMAAGGTPELRDELDAKVLELRNQMKLVREGVRREEMAEGTSGNGGSSRSEGKK
ncbi:uncharacterized protein L3040_005441 [Drepanopeziza brunnea f. sp. 'multigermtubi']|uniref:Ataxin-10 homolog n=1 Tax=Marssonina brunnea f. sp. multigermtubi (strain MB_m1) TaxID=1072389 RepID=K1XN75_MARBU|nr:essential cytoplasmic protein [Drepanopeziza brunnea f. sp. 'multigermtubi' MB_m1]EKD13949.1 essential cytoplasmic protein [Drepanopeziza brunnea f. sp. 'multigermtubi' MB_m1]KAJ5040882.1 hypothetical protein L3040_005441 [Drepanopeziza brunnea f. sp. 'multigermtubi']